MERLDYRSIIRIFICFIAYYFISVFVIHKYIYTFILKNLFLAMIPLGIAFLLQCSLKYKPDLTFCHLILGFLWLIFFPNAPYLITDLVHMNAMPFYEVGITSVGIEYWVSLLHIGGGIIFGLFAGMYSLMMIHRIIAARWGTGLGYLILIGICLLTGYAVYVGRFIRLNSWDVINPLYVMNTLFAKMSIRGSILSLLFGVFILICYIMFSMFTDVRKN